MPSPVLATPPGNTPRSASRPLLNRNACRKPFEFRDSPVICPESLMAVPTVKPSPSVPSGVAVYRVPADTAAVQISSVPTARGNGRSIPILLLGRVSMIEHASDPAGDSTPGAARRQLARDKLFPASVTIITLT